MELKTWYIKKKRGRGIIAPPRDRFIIKKNF